MRRRPAMTLVELLVVLAVVALLMALLLPTLGGVRESARDVECRSNLRQVQLGWHLYMESARGVIPYTKATHRHPNWLEALDSVFPQAPLIFGADVKSFNSCPSVRARYPRMFYLGRWGYAINSWWSNDGAQLNERQSWQAIRRPSAYPWLMDPNVYAWGSGWDAAAYVPNVTVAGGPPLWGVGANHRAGATANVAWADGSAQSVRSRDIAAEAPDVGQYDWFANR